MANIIDKPTASIGERRRIARAEQIAHEVDPNAGGFFRKCLERAALLGMEFMLTPEDREGS